MKRRYALGVFKRQKGQTVANTSQPGPREGVERKKSKEVGRPREIGPCRTWEGILLILSATGSHWRIWNKGMRGCDLCFTKDISGCPLENGIWWEEEGQ